MGILDTIRQKGAAGRLTEEMLYAEVLREMESGIRRDGLWAKALTEAAEKRGDPKALYIKLRVQALRDELTVTQAVLNDKRLLRKKKQAEDDQRLEDKEQKEIDEWRRMPLKEKRWSLRMSALGWCLGGLLIMLPWIAAEIVDGNPPDGVMPNILFTVICLGVSLHRLIESFKRSPQRF